MISEADAAAWREDRDQRNQRKIYVASSWRNEGHAAMVKWLRELGHAVYDFKNPPNGAGFSWKEVDYAWKQGDPVDFAAYKEALAKPRAQEGFKSDFDAMKWADTFVLLLPCGRSAHIEAGWAIGAGKDTFVMLHEDKFEPELMYLLAGSARIVSSYGALLQAMFR